jgi:acetoacetate decarboxylase
MTKTYVLSAEKVRKQAYCMPLAAPSYGRIPLQILDRESLAVSYRTDLDKARSLVPEPLEVEDPVVTLTFLYMVIPGIGSYHEVSQSIAAKFRGEAISFRPTMFVESAAALLSGRDVWGLPKKWGQPRLTVNNGTYMGSLHVDDVLVARATMGYRYETLDLVEAHRAQTTPCAALKIVPHVDGSPRILELVRFGYTDVKMRGAWNGPTALELHPHALAPLADLPVREIVSSSHTFYDAVLPQGEVIHDYLAM